MRMVVRGFAVLLFVATAGLWAGLGGSLGWTQSKPHGGHSGEISREVWRPGAEFLALGIGGSVLIFASTLFVRITPKP